MNADIRWQLRLEDDRKRAERNQSPELAQVTEILEERARDLGASAFVLTGSTARARRTSVSDLDYHVVSDSRPDPSDLPGEIDLYADTPARFVEKLRNGDDFPQWTARFGCVLWDSGVIRESFEWIERTKAWPDPDRKLRQARDSLRFAEGLIDSGDYDAALEQCRSALSILGRGLLLESGVFPLARDELPAQIAELGQLGLAEALRQTIHGHPSSAALRQSILRAQSLIEPPRRAAA
jgi:predicted nucleotidyltransferase